MKKIAAQLQPYVSPLLVVLILGHLVWIGWFFANKPLSPQEFATQYPYIDVARNFIPQEDFIVNLQPLRNKLEKLVEGYGKTGELSVYVEFLNTGSYISINPDTRVFPASLTKVPTAMMVMKKLERSTWNLGTKLALEAEDIDSRSYNPADPLSNYEPGTKVTIEKLLQELLVYSDNTASNTLVRNLTLSEMGEIAENVGLYDLYNDEGRYSAREYARVLRSLYTSSFLTRENSEQILKWLDQAPFNAYLAHSIPEEIPFAHKYAENVDFNVYGDAGIVYIPGRPYLLVVMIQESGDAEAANSRAAAFMQKVSKEAYTFFSKN